MKITLLAWFFISSLALADPSDEPGDHIFTIPSPANKFHVVQTVRNWKTGGNLSQFGRIQVFDTESGTEVWRMDGILADQQGILPADDGVHLVLLESRLRGTGNAVKRDVPVLRFYAHSRLVKSYTLDDLNISSDKLSRGVSHSAFFNPSPISTRWKWEWPLGTDAATFEMLNPYKPNPFWHDGAFELTTIDRQMFRFAPSTGAILSRQSNPVGDANNPISP